MAYEELFSIIILRLQLLYNLPQDKKMTVNQKTTVYKGN